MVSPETILEIVAGIPRRKAILLLAEAIHLIASREDAELSGTVEVPCKPVPTKARKVDHFTHIWDYLATVGEYETVLKLHTHLIEHFGADKVPSRAHLQRYLRGELTGRRVQ